VVPTSDRTQVGPGTAPVATITNPRPQETAPPPFATPR